MPTHHFCIKQFYTILFSFMWEIAFLAYGFTIAMWSSMAQGLNFAANFFNCLIAIFVPPTACFSVPLQLPTQGASIKSQFQLLHYIQRTIIFLRHYTWLNITQVTMQGRMYCTELAKDVHLYHTKKKLQRMLFVPFFSAQRRTQLIFSTHHDVCTRWFVYLFTYILSSFHFQHSFQSTPSEWWEKFFTLPLLTLQQMLSIFWRSEITGFHHCEAISNFISKQ